MQRAIRCLLLVSALTALPGALFAQAVITGVVKDSSGAVLPGVTVEAASPALIEKVRTAVSDGSGQYRIVDLRPGPYSVTFSLSGFSTSKREGIELAGTVTVAINAEMKVGAVTETLTVTGETPLVDVQSVNTERAVNRDLLDSVPTGRTVQNMAALIPGMIVTATGVSAADVGGSSVGGLQQAAIHGGSTGDQRVMMDGLPLNTAQGNLSGFMSNIGSTQEFTIDTSGVSAEDNSGGVRMNIVPREGGNVFHATIFGDASGPGLQASNFNSDLAARGLPTPNPLKSLKQAYTFNPAGGGPIRKDKLWIFVAANLTRNQDYRNIYPNLNAGNPNAWTYVPDTSKPQSVNDVELWSGNGRMTWQVTPKNKLAFYYENQVRCICPEATPTTSPEARRNSTYPKQQFISATYTAPVTNRLLLDAAVLNRLENWGQRLDDSTDRSMIRVVDNVTGITYRSFGEDTFNFNGNTNIRGNASLVTGAHSFKTGFQSQWSSHADEAHSNPLNVDYTFSNTVPNQITQYADPRNTKTQSLDLGVFAQDRWTIKRLTLTGGLRYDRFHSYYPAATIGPFNLAPTRNISFPAGDGVNWKDITYRMGGAYDLFGTGRTAVKVTLNKYLGAQATTGTFAAALNPANRIANSTTRSWNDSFYPVGDPRRGNFFPDCNLALTTLNAECGPMANAAFGQTTITTTYDPAILNGWGIRNYNWEFGASVQQQVMRRVSVDVGYFRRWYGNFTSTDNLSVGPNDYGAFSYTAPTDARLVDGGGQTITGLFNVNPNKVGQTNNFLTLASNYGDQVQRWQGIDVNASVRAMGGLTFQGGVSTGSTFTDSCEIRAALPETNPLNPYCNNSTAYLTQIKGLGSYRVPKIDVQVSAGIQSTPGPAISANQVVANGVIQPSLGRPLSGNAANVTINIAEPNQLYGDRLNQVDLRIGKLFRFGQSRLSVNGDLFNMLNASAVVTQNNNYTSTWQVPQAIMPGRLVKLSAQFDF